MISTMDKEDPLVSRAKEQIPKGGKFIAVRKNPYNLYNLAEVEYKEDRNNVIINFAIDYYADPKRLFDCGYKMQDLCEPLYNRLVEVAMCVQNTSVKKERDLRPLFWKKIIQENYSDAIDGGDIRGISYKLNLAIKQTVNTILFGYLTGKNLDIVSTKPLKSDSISQFEHIFVYNSANIPEVVLKEVLADLKYYEESWKEISSRSRLENQL